MHLGSAYLLQDTEDSFYVFDLGHVIELYETWTETLPDVKPFYAVKCNSDLLLLKTLDALGVNFEVVSKVSCVRVLSACNSVVLLVIRMK